MINIQKIWKTKEVRNSVLFVFGMLFIFRVLAHIPISGIDVEALTNFFNSNSAFGLLNVFSGGTLSNFSIAALGVAPYITSSIIFQLLVMIVPQLEEMQKEEQGRQKINKWTRLATVPLAALQSYGLLIILQQQAPGVLIDSGLSFYVLAMISMTAGTMFLTWLGELISEKRVGNGISIVILASILSGLPTFLQQTLAVYDRSQLVTMILFVVAIVITIVGVVIVNEGQRNIPVQYARHVRGTRSVGGVTSHIPLRVNMAGVIPIIFAISLIMFPSVAAQFFINARTEWIREAATLTLQIFNDPIFYGVFYFFLVFCFTFFYTAVIFHPDNVAENLQKQGGFIPGIRPGRPTAEYLGWVTNRVLFFGAIFLSLVAVLPMIIRIFTGNANLVIGGTSILIIVSVLIDSVKQIEGQLAMREYDM